MWSNLWLDGNFAIFIQLYSSKKQQILLRNKAQKQEHLRYLY